MAVVKKGKTPSSKFIRLQSGIISLIKKEEKE
jgi:hypothetical protein